MTAVKHSKPAKQEMDTAQPSSNHDTKEVAEETHPRHREAFAVLLAVAAKAGRTPD